MNKSIAVAGTGYVGLSISVLLAQHNHVVAVDIIPEKIALINQKKSPSKMNISKNTCRKRNWILRPPQTENPPTQRLILW